MEKLSAIKKNKNLNFKNYNKTESTKKYKNDLSNIEQKTRLKNIFKLKKNNKSMIDLDDGNENLKSINKIDKNKKSKKNIKKKQKNNIFFKKIKENKLNFSILSILTLILTTSIFVLFSKNQYYDFLKRPKILASSNAIIILLGTIIFLLYLYYFLNLFISAKNQLNTNSKNRNKANLEHIDKEQNDSGEEKIEIKEDEEKTKPNIVDITKRNIFRKLFALIVNFKKKIDDSKKKYNCEGNTEARVIRILYFCIFSVAFLLLFFILKILAICVFCAFAIAFSSFVLLTKSKNNEYLMLVSIVLLLTSFSNLLSFYFLFMLN